MMEADRRSFLKGMFTAVVLSAVPVTAQLALEVPRIVGDGVHDDGPGLSAALKGKPFICEGCVVTVKQGTVTLRDGVYRINHTVKIPRGVRLVGHGWGG